MAREAAGTARGADGAGDLAALGRSLFRIRGWLYVPFAVFALTCYDWEWEDDAVLWPLGLSFLLAGAALRYAAIRHIGGSARTHKDTTKRLRVSGPYAWVRNPLYLANLTAFAGFVVLCELPWFAALSVLFLGAACHAIARWEEAVLAADHGPAYDEYRARVPMWIPRRPAPDAPGAVPDLYPVGRLLRRERGAVANLLVLVALAVVKELLSP